MSEMVERVKAVIGEVAFVDYTAAYAITNLEEVARAVIAAMRKPTENMRDATITEKGCGCPCCVVADDWETMIDAALAD